MENNQNKGSDQDTNNKTNQNTRQDENRRGADSNNPTADRNKQNTTGAEKQQAGFKTPSNQAAQQDPQNQEKRDNSYGVNDDRATEERTAGDEVENGDTNSPERENPDQPSARK